MDYTYQADYNCFLLELAREQSNIDICIEEALILTEGVNVVPKFRALHEGVGDKIKELWNKFIGFIKKVFARFTEAMTKILDVDKGWLEKYKDIILKKPFKLEGVKCRDYKLDRIASVHLELFNYSSLSQYLSSKTEYMKHYFNGSFGDKDNTDDLGGWCKNFFCGGSEEAVDFKNPNMTDLYNYCHDWKDKTLPDLTKDKENLIKSSGNASTLINSAISNAKTAEEDAAKAKANADAEAAKTSAAAKPDETSAAPNDTEGEIKVGNNSAMLYSNLYNRVLSEDEKNTGGAASIPNQKNAAQTTANAANTGDADKKFSKNAPGTTGDAETAKSAQTAAESGLTTDSVSAIISVYEDVSTKIATAKITVSQWAYSDYMKILRAHVKMYVGDSDTADQTAQAASNYKPPVGAPDNPKDKEEFTDKTGNKWTFWDTIKQWLPFGKKPNK